MSDFIAEIRPKNKPVLFLRLLFVIFRQILKPESGKILIYLLTGHPETNICREIFESIREDFPDLLGEVGYKHDGLSFEDGQDWQSNFQANQFSSSEPDDTEGSILPSDYRNLIESSGFTCLDFAWEPQCFRVPPQTVDVYFSKKVLRPYREDLDPQTFTQVRSLTQSNSVSSLQSGIRAEKSIFSKYTSKDLCQLFQRVKPACLA